MGTKISPRLARIGLGFAMLIIVGILLLPRFHGTSPAAMPTIEPPHWQDPQPPLAPSSKPVLIPASIPSAAVPHARSTPCQPCQQAANEVMQRYLTAIRTGAGPDNRTELNNVYEVPQTHPSTNHPVWSAGAMGYGQSHP